MFHLQSCTLKWEGKRINVPVGKKTFLDEAYFEFIRTPGKHGIRYQLHIHPKRDIVLDDVQVLFYEKFAPSAKVFCNGYQSWSESQEHAIQDQPKNMRWPGKHLFKYYGDEHLGILQQGAVGLRSWTYGYVREEQKIRFLGSINESSGFTLIEYLPERDQISARIDCAGLIMQHSFPILDLWVAEGSDQEVFDEYFANIPGCNRAQEPVLGWTSWYQFYREISQKKIHENVRLIDKKKLPFQYVQIDDGFQKETGDWLDIDKDKFPKGLASTSKYIREKGFKAGIWIAPFVCSKNSKIFRQHPEWLIKDEKGKPVKIGYNPLWGGWYYGLNFYDSQFQQHLIAVFVTLLEKWKFDLIKIDFLFAAAIHPPKNKTAGQAMHEAMTFLRHTCGDKKILACGVPLGAAFGKSDYCRIGADIHLKWEHGLLNWLRKKERVSCAAAMRSVFSRWHLNNRAFGSDPDVYILREEGNQLTLPQKQSILLANRLLGCLLFTSDQADQWTKEEIESVKAIGVSRRAEISAVQQKERDRYLVLYQENGTKKKAYFNFTKQTWTAADHLKLDPYASFVADN